MKFKNVLIVSMFAMVSCKSVSPEPVVSPNNKQGYHMRCSGLGRTLEECYEKSAKLCPKGYNIVYLVEGRNVYRPTQLTIECK